MDLLNLNRAIYIASKAHLNDLDKGGSPYILHPIRVMQRLRTQDQDLMCIAILHDVIEDHGHHGYIFDEGGKYTYKEYLELIASRRVLEALDCLTRRKGEEYEDFIDRCCLNYDAVLVKIEDLKDNSDITRMKGLRDKDFERLKKYQAAYAKLWLAKKQFEEAIRK